MDKQMSCMSNKIKIKENQKRPPPIQTESNEPEKSENKSFSFQESPSVKSNDNIYSNPESQGNVSTVTYNTLNINYSCCYDKKYPNSFQTPFK